MAERLALAPHFKAPAPLQGEPYDCYFNRMIQDFEIWATARVDAKIAELGSKQQAAG